MGGLKCNMEGVEWEGCGEKGKGDGAHGRGWETGAEENVYLVTSMSDGDEQKRSAGAVRWGCVGLGGYAGGMSDLLWSMHERGELRYVAACDPALELNQERVSRLRAGGVKVFGSLGELLATEAEAVWLPVPIDLHLPFTRAALENGKAVLCEKPAAGALGDVDLMIEAGKGSRHPVAIGFQHIYDPGIGRLKRAIVSGELGSVESATVVVGWPRDDVYYQRNTWAARWKRGDTWVLDSPVNNAMAHYLNLALYLMGSSPDRSAMPERVEAEHYRANPIETYDTAALRVTLRGGCRLLVFFTHACSETVDPRIELTTSRGRLVVGPENEARFSDGRLVTRLCVGAELRRNMVVTMSQMLRGETPHTPVATLECARTHSLVVSASVQAAGVRNFPEELIAIQTNAKSGGKSRYVKGIEGVMARCAAEGKLPSELGVWPWAGAAGVETISEGWTFRGPHP